MSDFIVDGIMDDGAVVERVKYQPFNLTVLGICVRLVFSFTAVSLSPAQ